MILVLGLITNVGIYVLTYGVVIEGSSTKIASCFEEELYHGAHIMDVSPSRIEEGGAPFKSSVERNVQLGCESADANSQISKYNKLFATWQFFANWIIWSLAWVGVYFVMRKLNAHPRH